jgi:hypothetical protein
VARGQTGKGAWGQTEEARRQTCEIAEIAVATEPPRCDSPISKFGPAKLSPFRGRSAAERRARRGSSASCGPAPGRSSPNPAASEARPLASLDPDVVCAAVVDHCGLDRSALLRRHDPHLARAVASCLRRRHTEATLRELALRLRLSRATGVPNLTRRLEARLAKCPRLGRELAGIMRPVSAQTEAPSPARSRPSRGSQTRDRACGYPDQNDAGKR